MDDYGKQDRGGADAYAAYLAGMDASMRQKVALTAAHLLSEGDVADMGMGSGTGSATLAALYPSLSVVGVDINPTMVELAAARYRLPNLRFAAGDIAEPCFEAETMEAILDSSVLHHVTTFNGYDRAAAARALAVQAAQLSPYGVLIVRDFLDPGLAPCWLDLPTDDGEGDGLETCSTAALFDRFSKEFRVLREDAGARGFPSEVVEGAVGPGWRRYAVARRYAAEFVLRKDYRSHWDVEVLEEYTYATQEEFEAIFASLGLRVLASTPLRNPWIVQHRFEGRFAWWDASTGVRLDWPATNYVIVGQKVPAEEGVRFEDAASVAPGGFLEMSWHRRTDDGRVFDLVRRPGTTVDVVPWFRQGDALHVLARRSYPRPILSSRAGGSASLDGARPTHYVTEPLNVIQGDKPLGQTVEELLATFAGIGEDGVVRLEPGASYYPSPGGLQEEVRSMFVEIVPVRVGSPLDNRSGCSTSGLLRSIEAQQVLRAAQVGGLPDARLELNVYELLLRHGHELGPWIGAEVPLTEVAAPARLTSMAALAARPRRRVFRRASEADSTGFLKLQAARYDELAADGRVVGSVARELVVPARLSCNTVAVAALWRTAEGVTIGIDDDDLPASQCFDGHSELLVTPAWRLPAEVAQGWQAQDWIRARLSDGYGLTVGRMVELGGLYLPSPGATPERVYPLAVEVLGERADPPTRLHWVPLRDCVTARAGLEDGHLRVVALRAAHALDAWRPA